MSHIGRELLLDCSTRDEFLFSFRCADCGGGWRSKPVRFSKSGVIPQTEGKRVIFDTLYQREKEAAWELAADEAAGAFNICPICHRLVCDRCFMICDDLDMCRSCAETLQEKGEVVLPREYAG